MEKVLYNHDAESSTSSSKRGSAAVNILTNFSEANTAPLYRSLQLLFFATIVCCALSNVGAYYATSLPWDCTVAKDNPLNDTMNMYAL
jgi:hypothetical protein